jgi:outer membrane receptor protein involved in Fe transport
MKRLTLLIVTLLGISQLNAQQFSQRPAMQPITISGKVIDKETGTPLEYATLVLQSVRFPERVTGGITDENGQFSVETFPGAYNVRIEFISFTSYTQDNVRFTASTDLGTISLEANVEQLDNVELVAERTTVELRLDKKVYNVGQDLTVKGGTVTDVLDNVPSVSVDVEGNIALRGNGSVQILINGKPSALSGLSTDALQQLPSDAIERVEIITNPSARYDAEGSAGIINIILRQEKTKGINGSATAYVGSPERTGGNLNLNLRRKSFNLFSNTSYRKTNSPGNGINEQTNYDLAGNVLSYQNEIGRTDRLRDGFNTNIGLELLFNEKTSLTQTFFYRTQEGQNINRTQFFNFDENYDPTISRERINSGDETDTNYQYAINFVKDFEKTGHKLTADFQYSTGEELGNNYIDESVNEDASIFVPSEYTFTGESQINRLFQFDYVLPLGEKGQGQFEAGYRGTFNDFYTDFEFEIQQENEGPLVRNNELSNELEYKEYVNAAYMQLGSKFNKFSVLGGLRMEASDIQVNSTSQTQESRNEKIYSNWFPSLFLGYEISEMEQFTLSYSKRLRRPRSWFINPFIRRNSNTNLFSGNPDLDPAYTDAFDFGYLKRFGKLTLNTSVYYNQTSGVFQFIQRETGETVRIENPEGGFVEVPVQLRSPINLASEYRTGAELTTSYSPKRGVRFSWNFNLFQQGLEGDFTYTNTKGETISQVFDTDNFTWFSRASAQFPLPGKIDFQTNAFYRGNSVNPQGTNKGILSLNLAMSKQILKDKGSISFNVSDLLNSRKRISDIRTATVATYSEFQWRQRQATLTFRYQFNEQDNNQRRRNNRQDMSDEGEMEFGTP